MIRENRIGAQSESPEHRFLTPGQLVERWAGAITIGALANWRARGRGPSFIKIGGRVCYRLADVLAFERANHAGGQPREEVAGNGEP